MAARSAPRCAPPDALFCVNKMKFRKNDIILIASLLVVSTIALFALLLTREDGAKAKVEIGGKLYGTYALNDNKEIDLKKSTLVIEDGNAFVKNSNCRDKICEHQGRINEIGETIVCLPNKIIITIE